MGFQACAKVFFIYIIIIAIYYLTIQPIIDDQLLIKNKNKKIDDQLIRYVISCLSSAQISNLCFWISFKAGFLLKIIYCCGSHVDLLQ